MDAAGFRYTIDANDLLVDASPAYFQFAAENRWRGAGQVEMCGWCDRFLVDAQWVEVEVASRRLALTGARRPAITHGICPDCAQLLASA